jgi:hypothetical protein
VFFQNDTGIIVFFQNDTGIILWQGKTEEHFLLNRREIRNTKLRKFFQERLERFNLTSKGTQVKAGCQEKASGRVLLFERELSMTSPDYRLDFLPVGFLAGCSCQIYVRIPHWLSPRRRATCY